MKRNEHIQNGPTPTGPSAGTGTILPDATLPALDGSAVALSSFSPRRNLVLVLLGAGPREQATSRLLDQLAGARGELDAEDATVLVVQAGQNAGGAPDTAPNAAAAFTRLVDEGGTFHRRMGAVDDAGRATPALVITDRYREIYHSFDPGDADWPRNAAAVVEWLTFINIQCPECGTPEW